MRIQVVTGAVRTNFITNLPSVQLVDGSIYLPGKESIEANMNTKAMNKDFTAPEVYANEVVANVLRKNPVKRQWAGWVAGRIWIVSAFLWATVWVSLVIVEEHYRLLTALLGLFACEAIWDN